MSEQAIECRRCYAKKDEPCRKVTSRREGRGVKTLKHSHQERKDDWRELVSDQGGGGW
jgi:hypothetical protein